jgi:cyanophycin synthetase
MGHIVEHVALELQTLAGMMVGFGRTRSTSEPGVYQVVFEYEKRTGRTLCRSGRRHACATAWWIPAITRRKNSKGPG